MRKNILKAAQELDTNYLLRHVRRAERHQRRLHRRVIAVGDNRAAVNSLNGNGVEYFGTSLPLLLLYVLLLLLHCRLKPFDISLQCLDAIT